MRIYVTRTKIITAKTGKTYGLISWVNRDGDAGTAIVDVGYVTTDANIELTKLIELGEPDYDLEYGPFKNVIGFSKIVDYKK